MDDVKTDKLFLEDSYLKECDAKVLSISEDGTTIVLDRTVFYPRGGGQPCDLGVIHKNNINNNSYNNIDNNSYNIIEVTKVNDTIFHKLDKTGLAIGDTVHCKIDWNRRYKLMKMHTASHLMDAVMYGDGEILVTGNELGVEKSRIDFSLKNFSKEIMQEYVDKTNLLIQNDALIKNYYLKKIDAMKIPGIEIGRAHV